MTRYNVHEKIGDGGFAEVFRGTHLVTGAEVALKMLRDCDNYEARHRFVREVRQLLGLRHRRIIAILDYNLEAERPWYAMPLMKGGTLTRWAGKLSDDTVRGVLREMAEVLAYIHAEGGFHRDIKPDNVLLDAAGQLAIGDFGLGNNPKYTVMFTQHGGGTDGYLAPELRPRFGVATAAADIYSLGATIFHLLTGVHPAGVASLDPWSLKRGVPKDLRDLVVLMVQADPGSRLSAQRILAMLGGRNPAAFTPLQNLAQQSNDNNGLGLALGAGGLLALVLLLRKKKK